MDFSESTKIVFNRIQKIEPELVSKIIGYLLLKEYGDREMIRLAFGPDSAIQSLINEAKSVFPAINLSPKPAISPPLKQSPHLALQFTSCPHNLSSPATFCIDSRIPPSPHIDLIKEPYQLRDHPSFVNQEEFLDPTNPVNANFLSNYFQKAQFGRDVSPTTNSRLPNLPEYQVKACHYYYNGYCKYGTNCRYFHGQYIPDSLPHMLSQHSNDLASEDHALSHNSLEKLEAELVELLKSRGGHPISIAMLPNVYHEKYGKVLQGDGYLTESQRHGKSGYSLTKLLARLSSIRLIDRPHGQHSVILAEDMPRDVQHRNERNDPGNLVVGSQQIYLTFPSESKFTEDDVSNYFMQFGPVHAVRIPPQEKRMFGFVSFVYPETVKLILIKGNPHFISEARVLVKPYREKSCGPERKCDEKLESPIYHQPSHCLGIDPGFHSGFLRKQMAEQHELALEQQRRRLCALPLTPVQLLTQPFVGYPSEEIRLQEDHFSCFLDDLKNNPTSEEKKEHNKSSSSKEGSNSDLPGSPFA